jgi:hypothetical protein
MAVIQFCTEQGEFWYCLDCAPKMVGPVRDRKQGA